MAPAERVSDFERDFTRSTSMGAVVTPSLGSAGIAGGRLAPSGFMVYNMNMTDRSGIYRIVHIESGKCYVGQSIHLDRRWGEHKSDLNRGDHHTKRLQNAWRYHGAVGFQFQVLEECPPEQLTEREQYWLDLLRPVYNSAPAAGTTRGMIFGKRSEETRAKQRAAWTPERRAAMAARNKANPPKWSAESRAKAAATHTGRSKPLSAKARQALAARNAARAWTPERAAARAVRGPNPDLAEANRLRLWTPEARAKMAATKKARFAEMSLEERRAVTFQCHTEESRAKLRAAWTPERKAKFAAATRARAAARAASN